MSCRRLAALLLAFGVVACVGLARAPWPAVETDLPAHPDLRQGSLPNGVRYLILPNAEPKDRVSLRLVVAAGALHENDDELGLAHFVEHMAFRGTRRFPAGSLTAALQRLGVGLGPDNTAFTYYDHTTYHLELPDASAETLREGLQVFREFAEGVTFDPTLIARERGVVLSELATRNTPQARSNEANTRFLWPEARQTRRPVGGVPATLQAFTGEQFKAFYDAWYRPERLAVIVVGNVETAAVASALEAELGALAARAPERPEPSDAIPARASPPDVAIHADPAIVGFTFSFEHPIHRPRPRDTRAARIAALHEALAFAMFHQRLVGLAHEPGASFLAPAATLSSALPEWQLAAVSVAGKIDDWKRVAAEVEREHRRAFQFGFTASELEQARTNFRAGFEQSVRTSATRGSSFLAGWLENCLVQGDIFATPVELQRDLADALARVTVEDCVAAFRRAWTAAAPHVFVATNPAFQITREQIAALLNESRDAELVAHADPVDAPVKFAYEDFGPTGKLVHEEHLADLDVRLAQFENGVRFNFKTTHFEADTVEVSLRVGEGKLTQPEDRPGLDLLANVAVTGGGLGHHRAQDLARLFTGRAFSLAFRVDTDACEFTARASRRDLRLTLQVVAAFLTDAAFRAETMRDARAAFGTMFANLAVAPSGPISIQALRDLAGGDRRFGLPTYDELFSRDLDDLKKWIEPQLKRGAIELSIVGDVGWEEARAAVADTIGALPARESRRVGMAASLRSPPPPPQPKLFVLDAAVPQGAIAWYWPVARLGGIPEERRCRLLADVLADRCRVRLREELGAAYTTSAGFEEIRGFPGLSYFSVYAEVPPAHLPRALQIIEREAAELARDGVGADEFTRAQQPFLRSRADDLRLNVYWGRTVLSDAQQYPERIAAARDRTADTHAITAAELSQLARQHLPPARSFKFVTVPAPAQPSASSTAAGNTPARPPSGPARRSPRRRAPDRRGRAVGGDRPTR